jgi:predicted DNA-binding transcriptional regulator YafY
MSMRDFSVGHIKQFRYKGETRNIIVEKVARDYVVGFDMDKGAYRSFRFDKMN